MEARLFISSCCAKAVDIFVQDLWIGEILIDFYLLYLIDFLNTIDHTGVDRIVFSNNCISYIIFTSRFC